MKTNTLGLTILPAINFASHQNHIPLIRNILITNTGETDWQDLTFTITANPAFAQSYSHSIPILRPGESYELKNRTLPIAPQYLADLTEKISGTLDFALHQGDEILHSQQVGIDLLPYDHWSGIGHLPEMIAAYSTPNHPEIPVIIRRAAAILEKWTGIPSFDGYQSKNPNRVRKQVAAIFEAIAEQQLVYCSVPAGFEAHGQRVRLADAIFRDRLANCLDISLLYAACLEAVGIHPIIVFIKGHAFIGAWLIEESFADPVNDDASLLSKRTPDGINEIVVVEATCMNAGQTVAFDEAVRHADQKLAQDFQLFVDIKRARFGGIRPLPLRVPSATGWTIVEESSKQRGNVLPEDIRIGPGLNHVSKVDVSKQQIWERKLLDLSLRNTLLNIRLTKSIIRFITTNVEALENELAQGTEFQVLAQPADWDLSGREAGLYQAIHKSDPLSDLVNHEFGQRRLRTYLSDPELAGSLTNIYRASRLALEENGANTLYIGLGLLKWFETPLSEKPRYAPILLIPVEIIRKTSHKGFIIRSREEETIINITLLEMLRQDFSITISMESLPRDEQGINVRGVFNYIRQASMAQDRWDVEEQAILGTFSFSKFILWNDIHNNAEKLLQHQLVSSLLDGQLSWQPAPEITTTDIKDAVLKPEELALPIATDSSQLQAILSGAKGHSFVLHGPPGTGKSQTITNIIAHALYAGKRVLFVAAKKAALDVVEHRLDSIGLAPFCLELHSNKAKKSAVLDQLKQATQAGIKRAPEAFQREASRLFDLRNDLHQYVEVLHRSHGFGYSLFDLISRYSQLPGCDDTVCFPADSISALTSDQWVLWEDRVAELEAAGNVIGHPKGHPLAEWPVPNYSSQLKADVTNLLLRLHQELDHMGHLSPKLSATLKLDGRVVSLSHEEALARMAGALLVLPDCPASMLSANAFEQTLAQVQSMVPHGKKRDKLRAELLQQYHNNILSFPAASALTEWKIAADSWFLPRWMKQNALLKRLKALSNTGRINKADVESTLEKLIEYQQEQQQLDAAAWLPTLLDFTWQNGNPDWNALEESVQVLLILNRSAAEILPLEELHQWRKTLATAFSEGSKRFTENHHKDLEAYKSAYRNITIHLNELKRLVELDAEKLLVAAADWKGDLANMSTRWLKNINKLRDWFNYRQIRDKATKDGLTPLITAYENEEFNTGELVLHFQKGLLRSAAEWVIDNSPLLSSFNSELFDQKVKRFRAISQQFQQLTRDELQARLAAKIPSFSQEAAQSSEIGILQRALRSNGRGISIRKLFDTIPNLLPRLTPCMLMSPISVAQYFELGKFQFDLVIFDEASQLPTCEAIGAIARAAQVIVVGDPRQMPPTNFFSTNQVDEDNIEKEDLESILDDCLALSMPSQYLLWHYRSRHESLIAFSNANYYENKLLTFPSPDDINSRVRHVPVNGVYDRSNTRQNKAEADAIVNEVVRRLSDPLLSGQSIGIVTFSAVQQILVDDLLDKVFSSRPDLEKTALERDEPLFVKNLENVQGDERDVILFSVCYGPDADGKMTMNFGPINRDGGWRRLNVAVSRARIEMMVFSSMRSDQLDLRRTTSEGVANLKAFLAYAEKGKMALAVNTIHRMDEEHSFEEVVADALRGKGYTVHTHVGSSSYKIDIAVVDSSNEHRYLLGILTDGRNYYQANTSRDREIVQVDVLRQLGWNIHKIWSTEWWENPGRVLSRLFEVLEHAKHNESYGIKKINGGDETQPVTSHEEAFQQLAIVEPADKAISLAKDYRPAVLGAITISSSEEFLSTVNQSRILNQVKQVIEMEAPISKSLLTRRILSAWGISRAGSRITAQLELALDKLEVQQVDVGYNIFLWSKGLDQKTFTGYRIARSESGKRAAEDLAPEEIMAVMKELLSNQISLAPVDLVRETAKLFGFTRLGPVTEQVMEYAWKKAVASGWFRENNGRILI